MTPPIAVLIVDDHPVVRRGLRVLLEVQDGIEVAGEAGDGATALALAAELTPDVILLDLKLPGMDGIAVLGELRATGQHRPGSSCSPAPPNHPRRAWRCARARPGCCTRTSTRTRWCGRSVRCTTGTCCSRRRRRAPWSASSGAGNAVAGLDALTSREREVLAEIAKGRSNREIARALRVAEKTVKAHVSSVLAKLGVQDRTQAALLAVRHEQGA